MEFNDLRSLVTVISFAVFVGIIAWAWSARRRQGFDEAARLALQDDGIDATLQSGNGARQ